METVAVIGAGVMGAGIAQVSAMAGYDVLVYDINEEGLVNAKARIQKNLNKGVELGKLSQADADKTMTKVGFTHLIEEVKADLIIEAVVEKLDIKTQIFRDLGEINGEGTIYASNTSSIPLTKLAATFAYPDRMVGIHYFNPAHIMKLVEVIKAEQTSDEVLQHAVNYVKSVNKTCIVAKDAPGFIVNRVARHFYVESLKVLEENVADVATIDALVKSSGFKLGPFQLMDLIGVETNLSVTQSMYELFNYDGKFRPSRIQQKKAQAGYYGRKSGKGFYNYD